MMPTGLGPGLVPKAFESLDGGRTCGIEPPLFEPAPSNKFEPVFEDPEVEPGTVPDTEGLIPESGMTELGEPGRKSDPDAEDWDPVSIDPKAKLGAELEPRPDETETDAPPPRATDPGAESALEEPTLLDSAPGCADAPLSDWLELPPFGLAPVGTSSGVFGAYDPFDDSAPSGLPVGWAPPSAAFDDPSVLGTLEFAAYGADVDTLFQLDTCGGATLELVGNSEFEFEVWRLCVDIFGMSV